jgi:tRNA pseudouridine38-40 synthase
MPMAQAAPLKRTRERPDSAAPGFQRVRLTVAYDGSAYLGWQVQVEGASVQGCLETALGKLFASAPRVVSSSRTDTGVHARGMSVHFDVPQAEWRMSGDKLILAANAHLPEDIRVTAAAQTKPDFHARFDAIGKQYRYTVWNDAAHDPLGLRQQWHVPKPIDLGAMRAAAATLVGRHDFLAFSASPGYERLHTMRNVTRCDVLSSGARITVVIEADGFLYKMCRGIVGTLVQVGHGRFRPEEIIPMLATRDRKLAGMTAPALGLVLWKVFYRKPGMPRRPHPADVE